VDWRRRVRGLFPLCCAEACEHLKALKFSVLPVFDFRGPCMLGHSKRGDHQHLYNLLGCQQIDERGQRADGFSKAHVNPQRSHLVILDELRGAQLVLMKLIVL